MDSFSEKENIDSNIEQVSPEKNDIIKLINDYDKDALVKLKEYLTKNKLDEAQKTVVTEIKKDGDQSQFIGKKRNIENNEENEESNKGSIEKKKNYN